MPSPVTLPDAKAFNVATPTERLRQIPLGPGDIDPRAMGKAILEGFATGGLASPQNYGMHTRMARLLREEGGCRDLSVARYIIGRELVALAKRELTGAPIQEALIDELGLDILDRHGVGITSWLDALAEEGVFWSADHAPQAKG